eukprot:TRINITY_DN12260_c0_g1_i1.p1 TRINITY_DN12260_c0_g1~~TRINITY_DN12260_c0_g1_i1.p1  ORF type:complete len:250 (+),score=59.41 TRINITY_DN12260_c0_g1_i1:38-751(+)
MSHLYKELQLSSPYKDFLNQVAEDENDRLMATTSTLYVGNLSFYTTEEQIYELFSKCGEIKRIIMGLNRETKTPCGFCFVEYMLRDDAVDCLKFINGTRLDDRTIRTDLDPGFKDGRQFGRGKSGGQKRDEFRLDYDPGRGGYGKIVQQTAAASAAASKQVFSAFSQSMPMGFQAMKAAGVGGRRKRPAAEADDADAEADADGDAEPAAPAAKRRQLAQADSSNPRFRQERDGSDDE